MGAGFEAAYHINEHGHRVDMVKDTQHDIYANKDYGNLRHLGMGVARDAARWHLIEKEKGRYDFSSLEPIVDAAKKHQVEVLWTLCHYGWPDHVDILKSSFVDSFARYAEATAGYIKDHFGTAPLYINPINEGTFLAEGSGERGFMAPFAHGQGQDVREQVVRATLAAENAIWSLDKRAHFVHVDPVVHFAVPRGRPDLAKDAEAAVNAHFDIADMITGRKPGFGGDPKYISTLGLNFYCNCEWELGGPTLHWDNGPRDERWKPLHRLLIDAHKRYDIPVAITETGHFGKGRADWIRQEVIGEIAKARKMDVPVQAVFLYPATNRRDWTDTHLPPSEGHYHDSGIWDFHLQNGRIKRRLNTEYAQEICRAQQVFGDMPRRSSVAVTPAVHIPTRDHS